MTTTIRLVPRSGTGKGVARVLADTIPGEPASRGNPLCGPRRQRRRGRGFQFVAALFPPAARAFDRGDTVATLSGATKAGRKAAGTARRSVRNGCCYRFRQVAREGMPHLKQALLVSRLNQIGASLAQTNKAVALIGLGSVGIEVDRLDEFSDLDFFVIVETGFKGEFLEHLGWLGSICPIVYYFRNTPDGYKLLFEDGVFCEFAIFEEPELRHIPFAPGRIVWKRPGASDTLALPHRIQNGQETPSLEWSLGEALTNLYVGISRFHRGEKLSAMRLVQCYAVDRVLELADRIEPSASSSRDVFAPERRYEERNPSVAELLASFTQGYERSIESARAILIFLERHFDVNQSFKQALIELFEHRDAQPGTLPSHAST